MTDEYTAAFDALEAANSARETQVEAMSTLISAMGEMLKAKGSEFVTLPKALYDEWVAAQDEALNWADANARWFDISTAPLNGGSSAKFQILYEGGHFEDAWSYAGKIWVADQDGCACQVSLGDATPWRPILSSPPGQLPAPLERLGEVLRRIKGVP